MTDPRLHDLLPAPCLEGSTIWIGDQWHGSAGGEVFPTTSPIDGKPLMGIARGRVADVEAAVASAQKAAVTWGRMDGGARGVVMRGIAAGIRARRDALGLLETLDSGRPITETSGASVDHSAGLFDYYAGLSDKLHGATVPMGSDKTGLVEREPLGVVAAISPWNYPLLNAATKIAPILACGNAMVLKPAEQTSLVTMLLAEIMRDAGLPSGTVNIVTGLGAEAGAPLVEHPDVAKVSFTGSTPTGRNIAAAAGRHLKSVILELGGKSPFIVFEDADLEAAAEAAVFTTFMKLGQTCTSCARVLVARSVMERFIDLCRTAAAKLRIGDPLDPTTQIGPIVSTEQLRRVERLTQGVKSHGLDLPGYRPVDGGSFFRPMIASEFDHGSAFAHDEIFGPVMAVRAFDDEEEVYRLANDTEYGLAGSVWTTSLKRAEEARRRLQCGIVWINCVHTLSAGTPVSGHKASGLGIEYGLEAGEQYTKVKTTVTMFGGWKSPFA